MPSKSATTGVVLGRFAPLHLGHQLLIEKVIDLHGPSNTLIIIGSATSLNARTPYTYCKRRRMVEAVYPEIDVIGIPDTQPQLNHHTEEYIEQWLKNLKQVETDRGKEFIFYGGHQGDLKYLSQAFATKSLLERKTEGKDICASKLREAIKQKKAKEIPKFVDPKVAPLALEPDFN